MFSGSAEQPWGSTGGSLDSEEEEIVAEIREVWRMSAVSYSVNEDSSDSIDAEEVALIKVGLLGRDSCLNLTALTGEAACSTSVRERAAG